MKIITIINYTTIENYYRFTNIIEAVYEEKGAILTILLLSASSFQFVNNILLKGFGLRKYEISALIVHAK